MISLDNRVSFDLTYLRYSTESEYDDTSTLLRLEKISDFEEVLNKLEVEVDQL